MEETHASAEMLGGAVILLGAAIAAVLLFRRLGLGAVLGYLVAGMLMGPQVIGLVRDPAAILGVAELGIVLLLFLVGLELNLTRLWRLKRDIFGLGFVQVVVCGLVLAGVIAGLARFSLPAALALGLPLALSSTAQVLPMLRSAGRMNTPFGERAFSVLLFQDLAIVPMITIIAALSRAPADPSAPPGWLLGLYTVGAIAALVAIGRYVLNPLFRLIGHLGEREMFVAAGLFTVLGAAAVMEQLHLSTALGAFIAGVMLADSPYRHELEADVEPFRSILLGLFFLAVGMMLDLGAIAERPLFVIGLAAVLVATKTLLIFGLARLFGVETRPAFALGLLLSQGGEFGFVLFAQARDALLIAPEAASLFGAIVTLSMATTPFLMALSRRFGNVGAAPRDDLEGPELADNGKAIVVGYGRFGQTVAQMLFAKGVSVTLIDSNPTQIDLSGSFGMKVYYGDGLRVDLLRMAGGEEARTILFCLDGTGLDAAALEPILQAFPQAAIFVRAFDRRHVMAIDGADVAGVVREVYESAIRMGREALLAVGVEPEDVTRIEADYRERDSERLLQQTAAGDMRAASDMMYRPAT